jgi:hypothetical protein
MYKSIFKRFLKGFIASGVATSLLVLSSGVVINSLEDLKQFIVSLFVAFLTGGLMAVEKGLRWKE